MTHTVIAWVSCIGVAMLCAKVVFGILDPILEWLWGKSWFVGIIGCLVAWALSLVPYFFIASVVPDNAAHEAEFFQEKPIEKLILNVDDALGICDFNYRNYGMFSTRSMTLDIFGQPEAEIPVSYGFLGMVFLYDDDKLDAAEEALETVQKSSSW